MNGWKSVQWTIIAALIIATVTGLVTVWRQFSELQARQEYLVKQTAQHQALLEFGKDAMQALQRDTALLQQADAHLERKLKEHEDFLREILPRLRAVEQRRE